MSQKAPPPPIDYRQKAEEKFDALKASFGASYPRNGDPQDDPRSYWKFGNAFDTLLEFLIFISTNDDQAIADIVTKQYAVSLKVLGTYNDAWFDDFGWWTIAATRWVQSQMPRFPDGGKFVEIRDNCWSRFIANAPFVWERYHEGTISKFNNGAFSNYKPAVDGSDGGVWNGYWEGTPDPPAKNWNGPRQGNPKDGGLQGIQNTVTNCVYLISAQRLAATNRDAKNAAEQEFRFLNSWLNDQSPPIWWEEKNLVRERVSHFIDEKGKPKAAKEFQTDWAWTGDQGLMLGAIVDRIRLMNPPGAEKDKLLERATDILSGVKDNLVNDGLLTPYTEHSGSVPGNDDNDYITGRGVFWRYLRHAYAFNKDLKAVIDQQDYKDFLKANADDAANHPTPGEESDDIIDAFDELTNDLAVLVAAYYILQKKP